MHQHHRASHDGNDSANILLGSQVESQNRRQELDDASNGDINPSSNLNVASKRSPLRNRISNFKWTWFACTMSTGGLAIAISESPKKFDGLQTIGKVVFILELVLFIIFTLAMAARFALEPKAFVRSITDPMESFFFSCFWLTQATIMGNIQRYAVTSSGPWLITVLEVLFWYYIAVTFVVAIFLFTMHFRTNEMSLEKVQPSWVLGIYPVMLAGTVASLIASDQPSGRALSVIIGGIALQGVGFMISFMLITLFVYRCFAKGLPPPTIRCGMFILVGTPGYTATALVGIAEAAKIHFPPGYLAVGISAGEVFVVVATGISAWLWLLSFMFFAWAAVCITWDFRQMEFDVTWWACIFPNIGWVVATSLLGKTLESQGIQWVSCGMIVVMACLWIFVGFFHLKAIYQGKSPTA